MSLPESGDLLHTHGLTYEEAVKNGGELLEGPIESTRKHGEPLPEPRVYAAV